MWARPWYVFPLWHESFDFNYLFYLDVCLLHASTNYYSGQLLRHCDHGILTVETCRTQLTRTKFSGSPGLRPCLAWTRFGVMTSNHYEKKCIYLILVNWWWRGFEIWTIVYLGGLTNLFTRAREVYTLLTWEKNKNNWVFLNIFKWHPSISINLCVCLLTFIT